MKSANITFETQACTASVVLIPKLSLQTGWQYQFMSILISANTLKRFDCLDNAISNLPQTLPRPGAHLFGCHIMSTACCHDAQYQPNHRLDLLCMDNHNDTDMLQDWSNLSCTCLKFVLPPFVPYVLSVHHPSLTCQPT